ncbi:MAG TPA: glycosyl hydrolase family 28-related protein [Opitutaceae bacterium]
MTSCSPWSRALLRVLVLLVAIGLGGVLAGAEPWRSSLYPEDWRPGFTDTEGRFLHDFSYAGYHRGERALPAVAGPVIDVTQAPYRADATGREDATAAIQAALDAAAQAGGGVVWLPAGTYRVAPPEGTFAALRIEADNVVLRGAGAGRTFLFNDSVAMRNKRVVQVRAKNPAWWFSTPAKDGVSALKADLLQPTLRAPVEDASRFTVGELVLVRIDPTPRFIEELGMTGKWSVDASTSKSKRDQLTLAYARRIVAIEGDTLVFDVPTRLPPHVTDGARVQKLAGVTLRECGVEDLSIGMRQHPGEGWIDENGYAREGTNPYDVHQSYAIAFESTENCWLRRVSTYSPAGNDPNVHVLSNGVLLGRGRLLTVEGCDFRFPQYRGGGGNGYLYALHGNDGLLRDSFAEGGRHNYDFGFMTSTGNVILNCTAKDGLLFSDFHMFLSAANLVDNVTCDGDSFEATFRPYGGTPMHGMSTTQSVFWNLHGLRYSTDSVSLGGNPWTRKQVLVLTKGLRGIHIIGTRGPASKVSADAGARVEGVGRGDTLQPRSLYLDQLARRLGR